MEQLMMNSEGSHTLSTIIAQARQRVSQRAPFDSELGPMMEQAIAQLAKLCGQQESTLLLRMAEGIHGRRYGAPAGDPPAQAVMAHHLNHHVFGLSSAQAFTPDTLVFTDGAGHGIGTVVNALRDTSYLRPGDTVALLAPLYAPYQEIAALRGLHVLPLYGAKEHNYQPGPVERMHFEAAAREQQVKLLIAVDPSNPTGRPLSRSTVRWLAALLQELGAIALVDAVYQELLDQPTLQHTLLHELPEQTLIIYSLSKAYCQTGSRLGAIAYSPLAERWLERRIGAHPRKLLLAGKDSSGGPLAHVTLLATPEQWRTICLLLLPEPHLAQWRAALKRRYTLFHQLLDLELPADLGRSVVPYYLLLELDQLAERWAAKEPRYRPLTQAIAAGGMRPGRLLEILADHGVEVLYAARFYPGREEEHRWHVRISVANQPEAVLAEAAARMRLALATAIA